MEIKSEIELYVEGEMEMDGCDGDEVLRRLERDIDAAIERPAKFTDEDWRMADEEREGRGLWWWGGEKSSADESGC